MPVISHFQRLAVLAVFGQLATTSLLAFPFSLATEEMLMQVVYKESYTPKQARPVESARQLMELGLKQAIELALKNPANVRFFQSAEQRIVFEANMEEQFPDPELRFSQESKTDEFGFEVGVRFRMPNFAEEEARKQRRKTNALYDLFKLHGKKHAIALETKDRYFKILHNIRLTALFEEKVQVTKDLHENYERLLRSNQATHHEVFKAKEQAVEAQGQLEESRIDLEKKINFLKSWIGIHSESDLLLTDDFSPIEPITVSSSFNHAFAKAVSNSRVLKRLEHYKDMLQADAAVEQAKGGPQLRFVGASFGTEFGGGAAKNPEVFEVQMGINIPLFSNNDHGSRAPALRYREEQAYSYLALRELREELYNILSNLEIISKRWAVQTPGYNEIQEASKKALARLDILPDEKAEIRMRLWRIKREELRLLYAYQKELMQLEKLVNE